MPVDRISYFCIECGRELMRNDINEKICGGCRAKKVAEKIINAVKDLENSHEQK